MKIIGMIILLIGCFILWQHFELKKFRITSYEYVSAAGGGQLRCNSRMGQIKNALAQCAKAFL